MFFSHAYMWSPPFNYDKYDLVDIALCHKCVLDITESMPDVLPSRRHYKKTRAKSMKSDDVDESTTLMLIV